MDFGRSFDHEVQRALTRACGGGMAMAMQATTAIPLYFDPQ